MVGSLIVGYLATAGGALVTAAGALTAFGAAAAFAINFAVSSILSRAFAPSASSNEAIDNGVRQQVPPSSTNSIPVVYGDAYCGGRFVDAVLSTDAKTMYYVMVVSHISPFGQFAFDTSGMYWGDRKITFAGSNEDTGAIVEAIYEDGITYDTNFIFTEGAFVSFSNLSDSPRYKILSANSNIFGFRSLVLENFTLADANINDPIYQVFEDGTQVFSLTDGAGNVDTKINGNVFIALYTSTQEGVITSANGAALPSVYMGGSDIPAETRWTGVRQMNGLAFAIVKINYNREAETTNIQTVTFKVSQYLNGTGVAKPGDVWYDYITNPIYGGAMHPDIVNAASANALNIYSDGLIPYTDESGAQTQPRYRINGVVDTGQSCLNNINAIMVACDSWNQYNAALGQWSVVINKEEATSLAFNDSNIIGEIRVSAYDITSSVNQIEAEFPSKENRDQSDFVYYETPAGLLYPNEPTNKSSIQLSMVNDSVQAQYLASRILEQAREDLIVNISTAYTGIQVDAGDVISITNSSYGWTAKLFRVMKVSEIGLPDGNLGATFELNEYNAQVYDDRDITKYIPAPNTDLPDPSYFGVVPVPVVVSSFPSAAVPSFNVQPYLGDASFATYAEIWYSAFPTPTATQRFLGGTTSLPSNGVPFSAGQTLPTVNLQIPAGNWYLFSRLVNPIANSEYSFASTALNWRPTTFQYTERYIAVAYADNATGTSGFSLNPRNKTYYGLLNNPTANGSTNPTDYTWYAGDFGTANYLLFANRTNRKFSFAVGNAGFANLGGAFVPTETSVYDSSVWGALEDGFNFIDLDQRTGQLTQAGTTAVSSADGLLSVTNNTSGSMVVSLQKFLNFGAGVYSKSFNAATLTVDVFGRVVGFTEQDEFFYSESVFVATAGQTSFAVTHVVGNILVFKNGCLLDTSLYSETTTTVVLTTACAVGEIVIVYNMRAVSTNQYYEVLATTIASSGTSTIVYTTPTNQIIEAGDKLCFAAAQPDATSTQTIFTVQSVNTSTKTITFTTSISGATTGLSVFRQRAAGAAYRPFSRYTYDLVNASSIDPTDVTVRNGFESVYVNGSQFNEIDYDLSGNAITGFPANVTGKMTVIMYAENNLGIPASNVTNTVAYSVSGALTYPFSSNPLALEIYANGVLLAQGSGLDYTASSSNYNLVTAFNNNFTLLNQQTFARDGAA
jgi:hypothetical protein